MEIEPQGDTAVQATDAMTAKQTACTPPTHPPGVQIPFLWWQTKNLHLLPNPLSACYKQKSCTCFEIPFPLLQIDSRERKRDRELHPWSQRRRKAREGRSDHTKRARRRRRRKAQPKEPQKRCREWTQGYRRPKPLSTPTAIAIYRRPSSSKPEKSSNGKHPSHFIFHLVSFQFITQILHPLLFVKFILQSNYLTLKEHLQHAQYIILP